MFHVPFVIMLIKRGTIRSYDAMVHRAAVQIAGSLSVYLPALPVSTALAASSVVAGRECSVLFHTDDDPEDAVVISVQGALPPTVSSDEIADADADTYVRVEQNPDEDIVRVGVAGTERFRVQTASPHVQATGDLQVSGRVALAASNVGTQDLMQLGGGATYAGGTIGLNIALGTIVSQANNAITGVGGYANARDAGIVDALGLDFIAACQNVNNVTLTGVRSNCLAIGSGVTVPNAYNYRSPTPQRLFATITNFYGWYGHNPTVSTNRWHIYAQDMSNDNSPTITRFLEFVNAMEVHGTPETPRAANATQLFLWEGTTPTRRRVQWKDGASIGAGDRVMVLV